MSQNTARHGPHTRSEDEDAIDRPARQPQRGQAVHPRRGRQPGGDGGVGPDEPDEGEFELIGDDDLGPADLGPAAPNVTDPDADSGRVRKI
jgi:hypothetical protein